MICQLHKRGANSLSFEDGAGDDGTVLPNLNEGTLDKVGVDSLEYN